ncbi:MAG: glycosyltransferase [Puniceicoccaceae bacterium]
MKVSGFTFLRNASSLGYPFIQSIQSILPLVDEYVISLGPCTDDTREKLLALDDPRIRIIDTHWKEAIRGDGGVRGFTYGQQKSTALFNCSGDWAFYLEGDEVVHEEDLEEIRAAMLRYQNDDRVESLVFDYLHFYGNTRTLSWSPRWYRRAPRIIKTSIPVWAPKGLFFIVLQSHKRGRYPRAAHSGARIFHYGYVRTEEEYRRKEQETEVFWKADPTALGHKVDISYDEIDARSLRKYLGTHPAVIDGFFPEAEDIFQAQKDHSLTSRERRHRLALRLERWFGFEINHNHFSWARADSGRRAVHRIELDPPLVSRRR